MIDFLVLFIDSIIVISLCLLVLFVLHRWKEFPRRVSQLLLGGFLLRVLTAIFIDSLGTRFGQFDFYKFDAALWQTAQSLRAGIFTAPFDFASQTGDLFYIPYLVLYSPVYAVFGHETVLIRFIFALVGTLFVFNLYRLGKTVHSHTAGLYAASFAALFPYWLYLSTIFYRDMLIMLVLSQMLLIVIDSDRLETTFSALSLLGLGTIVFILRPENIVVIGVLLGLYTYRSLQGFRYIPQRLLSGTAMVILMLNTSVIPKQNLSNALNKLIDGLAKGGGAYLVNVRFSGLLSVLSFAPLGALYFLLVPFPWQIHNVLALFAFLQNLVLWYPTVLLAVFGVRYLTSRNQFVALVLLGFVLIGAIPYGIVERNMGPALRHRSQFQMVFVVCAAIVAAERLAVKS